MTTSQEKGVLNFIQGKAGSFLDEIVDFVAKTWNVRISCRTASRMLRRNKYTRKRGTRRNHKFSVIRGMQFLAEIRELYISTPAAFASIDEMSVMLNIVPSYGYAPHGQRAVITQPNRRTVSRMLTLCISPEGILHRDLRASAINGEVFGKFLSRLPDGLTLMLDSSPVHHASKSLPRNGLPTIAEVAESKNITLKYIPSYAPHLNPVEYTFNLVRNLLRRRQAWTEKRLFDSLTEMFQSDSFSRQSLSKLFQSVAFGGSGPGNAI